MWLVLVMAIDWGSFTTEPFSRQKAYISDCVDPSIQYVSSFCGIQSGKTFSECDGGFAALYGDHPIVLPEGIRGRIPMEVWLVSKSYSLAEVLFETFRMRTPEGIWASEKQIKRWGLTRGDRFTWWLVPRTGCDDPCPIKLRVRTASDPNSLRATNKLGLALCDELAWWKELAWFNLQGRGLVARTKYIAATSPHGKNFAYRTLALPGGYGTGGRPDPKISVHAWTSSDNPHADKTHIERLRKIFGREYAKQELEGLFTDAIGYVFANFDRTVHMVRIPSFNPDDYEKLTAGIDPGWTDPFVGCIWAKYRKDGRWYQVWELHETNKTSDDLAPRFKEAQDRWGVKRWQTDKRKPSDINRLRKNGVFAVANLDIHAEDDRRTIPVMLSIFQGLMQDDKIRIAEDHEYTAEEFEKYHYPDPSDDNPTNTNDVPVDWKNHHMDAGRYALCAVEEVANVAMQWKRNPRHPDEMIPASKDLKPKKTWRIPSLAESLASQDKDFEKRRV